MNKNKVVKIKIH